MARKVRPVEMAHVRESEANSRLSAEAIRRLEFDVAAALRGRDAGAHGHGAAKSGFAPPSLTGGEHHEETAECVELMTDGGQVKIVVKRTGPDGGQAFIDWINFTCHEDTAHRVGYPGSTLTDDDIVKAMSYAVESIFGFGITEQFDRGRNFYRRSYGLGEDGYGFVAHGGQRNTVMVSISGTGLAAARVGWEYRLRHFCENIAVNPKLTRVDVAHDCFEGEYTPMQASDDYDNGMFKLPKSPTNPAWEERGDWKAQRAGRNTRGITAYIGVRTSGKFCRVYEKGRQLGDKDSKWVRVEVEFKSVDRIIPFDILTAPGAYLTGAYPAFGWISERQERITTIRETKVAEKLKKEEWITSVAGPDLAVLVELERGESEAERALNLINRIKNESKLPKWARLPDYRFCPAAIHKPELSAGATEEAIYTRLEKLEV